jgi:hypothetical protein
LAEDPLEHLFAGLPDKQTAIARSAPTIKFVFIISTVELVLPFVLTNRTIGRQARAKLATDAIEHNFYSMSCMKLFLRLNRVLIDFQGQACINFRRHLFGASVCPAIAHPIPPKKSKKRANT